MKNLKTDSIPVLCSGSEEGGIEIIYSERGGAEESGAGINATKQITLDGSQEAGFWSDAELIALVRCDPPDEAALEVLVARHWDVVFARCQMLTQNHDKALDLTQATWCRLLRARQSLKLDGNFSAYLATIATNLFRDSYRASRRAGPMAEYRLESLDAAQSNDDGEVIVLVDILVDIKSLNPQEQALLAIDIDQALEQLTPHLREIVIARFIDGESCADIGQRHGRTEQTVSGWVREALSLMKSHLEKPDEQRNGEGQGKRLQNSGPAIAFSKVGCRACA
jgi:RNA polymerase sigma factor (sigma-70 family)